MDTPSLPCGLLEAQLWHGVDRPRGPCSPRPGKPVSCQWTQAGLRPAAQREDSEPTQRGRAFASTHRGRAARRGMRGLRGLSGRAPPSGRGPERAGRAPGSHFALQKAGFALEHHPPRSQPSFRAPSERQVADQRQAFPRIKRLDPGPGQSSAMVSSSAATGDLQTSLTDHSAPHSPLPVSSLECCAHSQQRTYLPRDTARWAWRGLDARGTCAWGWATERVRVQAKGHREGSLGYSPQAPGRARGHSSPAKTG